MLAVLTVLAGAFAPTVQAPVITLGSIVGNAAGLSVTAVIAYWFVRVPMGFFLFGLLGSLSDRFARDFVIFVLLLNAIGCIPLIIHPLMNPEPIDDPAAFAAVPGTVLGLIYRLRRQAGAPSNKGLQ